MIEEDDDPCSCNPVGCGWNWLMEYRSPRFKTLDYLRLSTIIGDSVLLDTYLVSFVGGLIYYQLRNSDCKQCRPEIAPSYSNLPPYGGKRKRVVPQGSSPKNVDQDQKDPSGDTSELPNDDDQEKKRKLEKTGQNSRNKQAKVDSNGGEPFKDDYIHVRAKRGQVTNSHSLAERERRERISERMRLLQELVPGCNKAVLETVVRVKSKKDETKEEKSFKLNQVFNLAMTTELKRPQR